MRWYGRFLVYLEIGTERSIVETYNLCRERAGKDRGKYVPRIWTEIVRDFSWRDRAAAWDDEQRRIADEEAVIARRTEQEDLLRLRRGVRQNEHEVALRLLRKAQDLLELPHERVKEEAETEEDMPDDRKF